jgi:type IV pilus assembly protein PilB
VVAGIIELLVKVQLLDARQRDAVLESASRSRATSGGHLVQEVAALGYAAEPTMARAISVELGLPRIDLALTPPEQQALALLDERTCAARCFVPVALREEGELLWLAMADPTDQDSLEVAHHMARKRVRPAVACPTEILHAVRTLYAAPGAASGKPGTAPPGKLAAIELSGAAQDEAFEVVNVGEDIDDAPSPMSRLAEQLGVAVPSDPPWHERLRSRPPPPPTLDELFPPMPQTGPIARDDLRSDDRASLDALRTSMEKAALVLRAIAELCVEKRVFTRDEMKNRRRR